MQNSNPLQTAAIALLQSAHPLFAETFNNHNIKSPDDILKLDPLTDSEPGLISLASNLVTDMDDDFNTDQTLAPDQFSAEYDILDKVHHTNL